MARLNFRVLVLAFMPILLLNAAVIPSAAVEDTRPTATTTSTTLSLVAFEVDETTSQLMAGAKDFAREMGIDPDKAELNLTVIIVGENLDSTEKGTLAYVYTQIPELRANAIPASELSFEDVDNTTRLFIIAKLPLERIITDGSSKTGAASKSLGEIDPKARLIILAGGPSQNTLASRFIEEGRLGVDQKEVLNQLVSMNGSTGDGARLIIISDKRGFANLPRKAAEYSPLARFFAVEWIPLIASLFGAAFVVLISVLKAYVEALILDRGKKGRKIQRNTLKIFRIKVREVLAILAAASVLGAAMSWTYAGPSASFIWLFLLNLVLCLIAGLSHEFIHWLMGRLLKVETEYHFWISGSMATILSAFLGNSFGLQGFLIDEIDESVAKWKVGLIKLASPIFSAAVMISSGLINLFLPHVVFQMTYSIAGILAMADILPVKPMDGYDVRRWSLPVWLLAFLFISASFIIVNFLL
ncbi:MAG: hypothetical protein PHG85_07355 [Candidatus Altiarchaeota archaeon]|nr:hypothetical protein [Candidatus Altiarchaeota archaeon]